MSTASLTPPNVRLVAALLLLLVVYGQQQQVIKSAYSKPMTHAINEPAPPPPPQDQLSHLIGTSHQSQLNDPINRAIHYHFDQKMEPFLRLHKFNSTNSTSDNYYGNNNDNNNQRVTCNDGTPTGYYKRLNNHSKSWIIYLQGGGFCASDEACRHRWRRSPHLMSSNYWPKLKSIDGILSSEPKDNPYLWNANHIYVPYCSSDSWTGLQEARRTESDGERATTETESQPPSYAFMGSRIIEKVLYSLFDDLPRESSLYEAKFILLAGDSAGATGVIMNLDKVNRLIQRRFNGSSSSSSMDSNSRENNQQAGGVNERTARQVPVLRGLADSGWFLDNEPYEFSAQESNSGGTEQTALVDCDRQRCTPLQSIRQAMHFWNGQVPAACAVRHSSEPWKCYFAYRTYATLKTPLFVVQWLYDEAQLMVDNIIRPETIGQWNYVNKLAAEMRASLENVSALFAPSCLSHSLIVKQSWNHININGFKLPHVLNNWEEEILPNQPTLETLQADYLEQQQMSLTISDQQAALISRTSLSDHLSIYDRMYQTSASSSFELRSAVAPQRSISSNGNGGGSGANPRSKSRKKKRNNNNQQQSNNRLATQPSTTTNRLSRSTSVVDDATIVFNNNVPDVLILSSSKQQEGPEKFRLIDSCGWPQCNRDCPYLDQDFNLRPILSYRRRR